MKNPSSISLKAIALALGLLQPVVVNAENLLQKLMPHTISGQLPASNLIDTRTETLAGEIPVKVETYRFGDMTVEAFYYIKSEKVIGSVVVYEFWSNPHQYKIKWHEKEEAYWDQNHDSLNGNEAPR